LNAGVKIPCENEVVKLQILPALLCALVATGLAQVPDNHTAEQAGAILFHENCARCHGTNLEGTKKGPSLSEIRTKAHWTDEKISRRIHNGAFGMPSFRDSLNADQIQQLVAYLRAENRPAAPSSPQ
jgi:mono/diheme cytochrome c family protein